MLLPACGKVLMIKMRSKRTAGSLNDIEGGGQTEVVWFFGGTRFRCVLISTDHAPLGPASELKNDDI